MPHSSNKQDDSRQAEKDRFEQAWELYMERLEPGKDLPIDALCRERPELAEDLKRIHHRYEETPGSIKILGEEDRSFSQRLGHRFGTALNPEITLDPEDDERQEVVSSSVIEKLSAYAPKADRYRLVSEVARGGMGAILKVWDGDLRRHLAMKVILSREEENRGDGTPAGTNKTLVRFLEEAQITGQLDHPGIVPVHELGLDGEGRVYFTMRLVRGRDLKRIFDLVHEGKEGWNRTRALGVLLKVCEAMAYAHAKGVIHRDLKPANIMVGRFGEVSVMDWGLAKVIGRNDSHDLRIRDPEAEVLEPVQTERSGEEAPDLASCLLTMDGDVIGTPAYMPPEQARGELDRLDQRADVYALGAMLYHLLAGRLPYVQPGVGIDGCTVWRWLLKGPPRPIHEIAPDLPVELEAICEKAMARDPDERYPGMMALAEDLRAFLENRVVSAHRTGPVVEFKKWVSRNRALASTIALALVILLGGAMTTSFVFASKNKEIAGALDEAQASAERADAINNFLVERMLLASTPEEAMGQAITVEGVLDSAARNVDEYLAGKEEVEADVRHTLAQAYGRLGQFDKALANASRCQEIRRRLLGKEDRKTLRGQGVLAWTQVNASDYGAGERIAREALEQQKRLFGEEDPDTLDSEDLLGDLISRMGRPDEAETLFRKTLEIRRARTPDDHSKILGTTHKLAHAVKLQGRLEEAAALFRELMEGMRKWLPHSHPDALNVINDYAGMLQDMGRLEEAEKYYRDALEGAQRVYGEEHFMYSVALNNMATLLEDRAGYENKPGLRNEAEQCYRQSLEIRRKVFSDNHPMVATALHNLAGLLHAWGRPEEAEPMIRQALAIRHDKLGPDNVETIISRYCLAVVLEALDRSEESEENFREVIASAGRTLGERHWRKGSFHMGLGQVYLNRQRFEEAEQELLLAYDIMAETLGEDHNTCRKTANLLVKLYKAWGKKEEASLWRKK